MSPRVRNVLIVTVISVVVAAGGLAVNPSGSYTLTAARVDVLPECDGERDALWDRAQPITVPLRGSICRVPHVTIRALHDGEVICFLLEWPDPTESLDRTPWEFDGSEWRKLPPAAYYEDKIAFYWPITDCTRFDAVGCSAICHFGGGKSGKTHKETGWPGALNVGAHYTPKRGQVLDEWHWKAARTNPLGQADDANLTSDRPTPDDPDAGRAADEPKETSGGYKDNVTDDGARPAYDFDPRSSARGLILLRTDAAPIEDYSRYAAGDRVPALVLEPLAGKRGDLNAKGAWRDGAWTVEIRRELTTGDPNDVDFASGRKRYPFGVAVFEAQQFEHSYSLCVQWLEFE